MDLSTIETAIYVIGWGFIFGLSIGIAVFGYRMMIWLSNKLFKINE